MQLLRQHSKFKITAHEEMNMYSFRLIKSQFNTAGNEFKICGNYILHTPFLSGLF